MDTRSEHQLSPKASTGTSTDQPTKTSTAAPSSPEKPSMPASTGWRLPRGSALAALVVVAVAAMVFQVFPQYASNLSSTPRNTRRVLTMVNTSAPIPPKYHSDIVTMAPRSLLSPDPACEAPSVASTSKGTDSFVSIEHALGSAHVLRRDGQVLLLLNGENQGLLFDWSSSSPCLFELAEVAATMLGADSELISNGLRLYNIDGQPITTTAALDHDRIAYVLMDFQLWVWPGIKVGHSRVVDNRVTLTTLSLSPLVYDVADFFLSEEADYIIAEGVLHLERSPVDGADDGSDYDDDRTSYTAFLNDSALTRDFRHRTARLARLPCPAFVERLQLVRYEEGQWFRQHEDYFDSKDFLNKKEMHWSMYQAWVDHLRQRDDDGDEYAGGLARIPPSKKKALGQWELALLTALVDDAALDNWFVQIGAKDWGVYVAAAVQERNRRALKELIQAKGTAALARVIQSYERRHAPHEPYSIPVPRTSGVTQYFRWLRWAKERVAVLGPDVPSAFQPSGKHYPKFTRAFQTKLLKWMVAANSRDDLAAAVNGADDWVDWIMENESADGTLVELLAIFPDVFPLVAEVFATKAGSAFAYEIPEALKYQEVNRFVTLFLYLNNVDEGGETVFPYSSERLVTEIDRGAMSECSEGLAVPPTRLRAALFYAQTGANDLDPKSLHGGCPPAKGVKFGANLFAWNTDADEGSNLWDS